VHHAADVIAESCPKDAALTPTGRLDEVRKKLDAVRQLTTTIRPALTHFYELLDDRPETPLRRGDVISLIIGTSSENNREF
jgi:hypothetical protein